MSAQKYSVNQHLIETLLSWVKSGEIAIPEIQRPFVWDASKVRDLMDSLYQGFPVGYIIAWRNPTVKLKDGSLAEGKKVLIDGQSVGAVTSYTFRGITEGHTIEVIFMKANGNPQTGVDMGQSTVGCGR